VTRPGNSKHGSQGLTFPFPESLGCPGKAITASGNTMHRRVAPSALTVAVCCSLLAATAVGFSTHSPSLLVPAIRPRTTSSRSTIATQQGALAWKRQQQRRACGGFRDRGGVVVRMSSG
ncbi:unnamed protein product, partial [Ectocarpus fasciculatus]